MSRPKRDAQMVKVGFLIKLGVVILLTEHCLRTGTFKSVFVEEAIAEKLAKENAPVEARPA